MKMPAAPISRRAMLRASLACAAGAALRPWPARAMDPARYDHPWIPDDRLLAELPEWMQAFGVPGVGIVVVEDGAVAWTHAQGLAEVQARRPVDADSVFECASLSKPVFAYLVLQLVDEGLLQLDRPLAAYARPSYLASDDPRLDTITVRDVLRHSSGLPNWREHPEREPLRTVAAPRSGVSYSGEAFFWLQQAVESAGGASLDQLARKRLFEPAGMHGSTYTWNAEAARRSVVGEPAPGEQPPVQTFHRQWTLAQPIADRLGKPLSAWTYADAERALPLAQAAAPAGMFTWPGDLLANAAASLRGPVADYARFIVHVMQRPARQSWELAESTRTAMLSPQWPLRAGWIDKGLGWNLERIDGRQRWFFHGGSNAGRHKAFVVGDPRARRGLVVMINGGGGTGVYQRIVRNATGRDLLAFDL